MVFSGGFELTSGIGWVAVGFSILKMEIIFFLSPSPSVLFTVNELTMLLLLLADCCTL
jgi:hypothetical protein